MSQSTNILLYLQGCMYAYTDMHACMQTCIHTRLGFKYKCICKCSICILGIQDICICIKTFTFGKPKHLHLLQNICFKTFASKHLLQNICIKTFASKHLHFHLNLIKNHLHLIKNSCICILLINICIKIWHVYEVHKPTVGPTNWFSNLVFDSISF